MVFYILCAFAVRHLYITCFKMCTIDLIFEAGNRSQLSLLLKLQESDGILLKKGTLTFALQRRRKVILKRMTMARL